MKNNSRNGIALLLLSSALLVSNGCNQTENEHTKLPASSDRADVQPVNSAEPKTPDEVLSAVESLVAPIALYPDPLLAEVLIAATYPLEIRQAARRLEIRPGQETAGDKNWDASLIRLERLPSVIIMLNEHPQWTVALGDAYLAAPETLLQAIQALRQRATTSGFLKDSAAQKVLRNNISTSAETTSSAQPTKHDIIIILPAEAEKIHLPLYDPQTVFSATLTPPENTANDVTSPHTAVSDETSAGTGSGYYPANYPVDSISSDHGSAYLAFGAGTDVPGLLTWGNIVWSGGGYVITHPYGNLTDCSSAVDCWMRSGDQGFYYANVVTGSLAQDGEREFPVSGNRNVFGVPWHHDPRHRRGVRYSGIVPQQLRESGPPPLAGQRLNGPPLPLPERGFAAPLVIEEAEAETAEAADRYTVIAGFSVFSGISGSEAGDDEALKRGEASRNRNKIVVAENSNGHSADGRRNARKPLPKQTELPEALRALYIEQQFRETALPSVFDADYDTAPLVARFSRRGAESRTNQMSADAAKTLLKQTSEEGD